MKRNSVVLTICFLVAGPIFSQSKNQSHMDAPNTDALAEVRRVIDKGNSQWIEGWAKGDAAMVSEIFADDGVQLANNGRVFKGRQQIMERQTRAMQSVEPGVKVTVTTVDVWLDGDAAYETGKYKYEYVEKGKPNTDEGRYVVIWRRQKDGSWKVAMDMGVPKD